MRISRGTFKSRVKCNRHDCSANGPLALQNARLRAVLSWERRIRARGFPFRGNCTCHCFVRFNAETMTPKKSSHFFPYYAWWVSDLCTVANTGGLTSSFSRHVASSRRECPELPISKYQTQTRTNLTSKLTSENCTFRSPPRGVRFLRRLSFFFRLARIRVTFDLEMADSLITTVLFVKRVRIGRAVASPRKRSTCTEFKCRKIHRCAKTCDYFTRTRDFETYVNATSAAVTRCVLKWKIAPTLVPRSGCAWCCFTF